MAVDRGHGAQDVHRRDARRDNDALPDNILAGYVILRQRPGGIWKEVPPASHSLKKILMVCVSGGACPPYLSPLQLGADAGYGRETYRLELRSRSGERHMQANDASPAQCPARQPSARIAEVANIIESDGVHFHNANATRTESLHR